MTDLEKTTQVLHRSFENISNSIIDNYIQKNIEFRYEAGMGAKIVRTSSGHCCEWCDKVAGTYKYPDVPKDVYRRHDNCDCTVEYINEGKRKNVWTKQETDISLLEYRKLVGIESESNKNFNDVTKEWIRKATPNSDKLEYIKSIIIAGVEYIVDNKYVIWDPKEKELKVVDVLIKELGGPIGIRPRVVFPENIKSADIMFRNEIYDIKIPEGKSKHTLYGMIKGKKEQSCNFIFDISFTSLSVDEAIDQIENDIYISRHTRFVDKIILIKNESVIKVYNRKK